MARSSSTSSRVVRSNEVDPAVDQAGDLAGSNSPAASSSPAGSSPVAANSQGTGDSNSQGTGDSNSQGTGDSNSQGTGDSNSQGTGDAAPPVKRRKRGPNKPKPGAFVVETNARLKHEQILELLTAHATAQLGPDVAARMVLQVNVDGQCRLLGEVLPQGSTLQFATVIKDDE